MPDTTTIEDRVRRALEVAQAEAAACSARDHYNIDPLALRVLVSGVIATYVHAYFEDEPGPDAPDPDEPGYWQKRAEDSL